MSTSDIAIIEPHAKALEACADKMEAAGIGCHPSDGHVVALRKMAGAMRADAATGKMPYSYTGLYAAAASKDATEERELSPFLKRLMAQAHIEPPAPGKTLTRVEVDAALAKANVAMSERLAVKIALERSGLLA